MSASERLRDLEKVLIEDVKLPASKKKQRDRERRTRIFKAYADAYANIYIVRPTKWDMTEQGLMRISTAAATCDIASEKRIKDLTHMMRERAKDR